MSKEGRADIIKSFIPIPPGDYFAVFHSEDGENDSFEEPVVGWAVIEDNINQVESISPVSVCFDGSIDVADNESQYVGVYPKGFPDRKEALHKQAAQIRQLRQRVRDSKASASA